MKIEAFRNVRLDDHFHKVADKDRGGEKTENVNSYDLLFTATID